MAKSKALLFAFGGSVVGILGYFLPWITVSIFGERSISGFSLVAMLFGAGEDNFLQMLGNTAELIIPAILLALAPIALLFTGVSSALTIRSNNVNKTSGILLTIASGIVFLIVAGIALLVSISIKGQVGSYVGVGSYIRYGVGFFVTSLSALVVMASGIFIFQRGELSESNTLRHFGQDEISHAPASPASGMDNQMGLPADNYPPMPDPGLAHVPQGYPPAPVFEGNQPNLQPTQVPQQQYTIISGQPWQPPQNQGRTSPQVPPVPRQAPYNQTSPHPAQTTQNQGWGLPPQSVPPSPGQFQPPAAANPPQPWKANQGMGWNQQPVQPPPVSPLAPPQLRSGNQPPALNSFPNQPPKFGQRNPQPQQPLKQANNRPPLDKPWERVRYNGPRQAPLTPQVLPVRPAQNFGQGQAWNPPPEPPYRGQEDPHTRPGYLEPLEDSDKTRYDRDLNNENRDSETNEYRA